LFGDYIWGTYTILILPGSFPFGGMENPLLTFASPTIITGEKDQVYVAIHEIVHSWSGNDVTCLNWENFWLNEGWTVFGERKVSEILFTDLYGDNFSIENAWVGNQSLQNNINDFLEAKNDTYATIHPIMNGNSPDDSFSEVPYERGYQTLKWAEKIMGKDMMDNFHKAYFQEFALSSIVTQDLREFFYTYVQNELGAEKANMYTA
jgi:leukotriene-A4 hydrolase